MHYASIQAIREGAGLLSRSENETLAGAVDGTNRAFTVKRRPIVDSDYDGEVSVLDVSAFVDGVSVSVSSVDAAHGVITLAEAPSAGTKVTATYCFSPLTDGYVETKQKEADSWVDLKIRGARLDNPHTMPKPTPGVVTTATELYAAGIILIRDWGSRTDTEQTSKDGFAKIKLATQLLTDYITGLETDERNDSEDAGSGQMSAVSDGDVFDREICDDVLDPDEWFMRRKTL